MNQGVLIVKTEYNSNLQCMCKTTHITHKPKYQNLFEKHVLSKNCTKRAGNLISKSQ